MCIILNGKDTGMRFGRPTKAKRKAAYPLSMQPREIKRAIADLQMARQRLRRCGSKNAADYVARALKSAEGALRHAQRMGADT